MNSLSVDPNEFSVWNTLFCNNSILHRVMLRALYERKSNRATECRMGNFVLCLTSTPYKLSRFFAVPSIDFKPPSPFWVAKPNTSHHERTSIFSFSFPAAHSQTHSRAPLRKACYASSAISRSLHFQGMFGATEDQSRAQFGRGSCCCSQYIFVPWDFAHLVDNVDHRIFDYSSFLAKGV